MKIPDDYLSDLLAHVPLADVAGRFTDLKPDGPNRLKANCPMHEENTPSFKIDTKDDHFHCYGCKESGNAITLVMQVMNYQFPDAVRWLATEYSYPQPPKNNAEVNPEMKRKSVMRWAHDEAQKLYATQLWGAEGSTARDYLMDKRGLTKQTLDKFGVGFSASRQQFMDTIGKSFNWGILEECGLLRTRKNETSGKSMPIPAFLGRVVFPIRGTNDRCVGFGGRILQGDAPKYINSSDSPIYNKSRLLYGLPEAISETVSAGERRLLRITEGYIDVLASDQAGLGRTVATCGTAMTPEQVGLGFRYADHLLLYFDSDNAGRRAAMKACEAILPFVNGDRRASVVLLPDNHDLDSMLREHGADRVRALEAKAVPMSKYMIQYMESQHPPTSSEAKALLLTHLSKIAESAEDPNFRSVFEADLRKRYIGPPVSEPITAEQADALLARAPDKVQQLLRECGEGTLMACATLCAKPVWAPLLTETPESLSPEEANLWQFCSETAQRALQQNIPTEEVFKNEYRFLVLHLKALGDSMTEEDRANLITGLHSQEPSNVFFLKPESADKSTTTRLSM